MISLRNSKDNIENPEGKNVLKWCKNNGMCILNGNFERDEEGSYIFIGHGEMVIDDSIDEIGTDHLPIKVRWEKEVLRKIEKYDYKDINDWSNEAIRICRAEVENNIKNMSTWEEMKDVLKNALIKETRIIINTNSGMKCYVKKKMYKEMKMDK